MTEDQLQKEFMESLNASVEARSKNDVNGAMNDLQTAIVKMYKLAKIGTHNEKEARIKRAENLERILAKLETQHGGIKPVKKKVPANKESTKETDDSKKAVLEPEKDTGISFADVIGLEDAKRSIMQDTIYPLKAPEAYSRFDKYARKKGILLYGVSGTGKTMFAKAVATEIKAPFYYIDGNNIKDKYVGETEKNIRNIFNQLRKEKTAILFFDEAEGLLRQRSTDEGARNDNIVTTNLIKEMDGFINSENIIVIAATNYPHLLDSAALSRFSAKIRIDLPSTKARRSIIQKNIQHLAGDITLDEIANTTKNYSGRDLFNFCNAAMGLAIVKYIGEVSKGHEMNVNNVYVTKDDIKKALDEVKPSVSAQNLFLIKAFEKSYQRVNTEETNTLSS